MRTCQVFVSHTSDMATFPETRSFVQATLDAVNRAGMAAVDMRYFAARGGKPADYCRQRVRDCEIYVAVVGFRYGSIVPGETISYTELEFEEAAAAGIPRLVFLLDAKASLPDLLMDSDRRLVDRFRGRLLQAGLVVRSFTSDSGLELEVFHALSEAPSHPAGMADEPGTRTREPGKPPAGAGRAPGPADVLTAGQHGRSSPGLGSDGAQPAGRPQRRILTITLACAILAAAGVVSFELARSSPPYQGGGGLGSSCSARRRMGRRADGPRGSGDGYPPGRAHQLHRHLARGRLGDPSRVCRDCRTSLSCRRYLPVHIRPAGRRSARADQHDP